MAISAILAHRRVRATPPWVLAGASGQLAADGTADRRWQRLSDVLLLTGAPESSADILPSLGLLPHAVRLAPAEVASVTGGPPADVMLIDARRDLMQAKSLVRNLRGAGLNVPILAVVAEGGWAAVTADWGADDVILHTAGPGVSDLSGYEVLCHARRTSCRGENRPAD